jgi:hypothetical protein
LGDIAALLALLALLAPIKFLLIPIQFFMFKNFSSNKNVARLCKIGGKKALLFSAAEIPQNIDYDVRLPQQF